MAGDAPTGPFFRTAYPELRFGDVDQHVRPDKRDLFRDDPWSWLRFCQIMTRHTVTTVQRQAQIDVPGWRPWSSRRRCGLKRCRRSNVWGFELRVNRYLLVGTVADAWCYASPEWVHSKPVSASNICWTSIHLGQLILIGFAGGLDPTLTAGDVVAVQRVIDTSNDSIELIGDKDVLKNQLESTGPGVGSGVGSSTGNLLTTDHLVASPREKQLLYERYNAVAVDMESYHVARLAKRRGVAVKIWRAVSDPADMELPGESLAWTRPDGRTNLAAVGVYLARRPWRLMTLISLARHASRAATALAVAVVDSLQKPSQNRSVGPPTSTGRHEIPD